MSRAIFGGLPQTFSLPPDRGTADQVISSKGDGTTEWVAGGGGGGGSGTVTSVTAGPFCVVTGTPTIDPVVGLNVGAGANGQVLSTTMPGDGLAWIDLPVVPAALAFDPPLALAAGHVSLPITGIWAAGTNDVVTGSSASALAWGAPAAASSVVAGANIAVTGPAAGAYTVALDLPAGTAGYGLTTSGANPPVYSWANSISKLSAGKFITVTGGTSTNPDIALSVDYPTIANQVLSSTTLGVLSWVPPGGGGGGGTVDSITAGFGVAVDSATAATPVVGLAVTGTPVAGDVMTYVAPTGGAAFGTLAWAEPTEGTVTSVSAADSYILCTDNTAAAKVALNVDVPANDNDVLASTKAGVLSWITPAAGGVTSVTQGTNIVVSTTAPASAAVPTISMPILNDPPTAGQIVGFSGTNTLAWVNNPADGVAQVKPGINTEIVGTATIPKVNVVVAGTYAATNVVGSTDGGVTMTWVANPADGVTSVTQGTNIVVSTTAPASAAVPAISMPILNDPPTAGQIVGFSGTNTLAWVNNPADGVTSVAAGLGIAVDNTIPATPVVNVAVRPNSFMATNVGISVNQLDLNADACPTDGYVLSSTVGGSSGSTVTPTLTWVDPLAGLSALPPVSLAAGVISLPIAGTWASGTNDVVKGSSGTALVWGSDSSGSGTVTSVTAAANGYCVIGGSSTIAPTIGLNLANVAANGQVPVATGAGSFQFIDFPPATLPTITQANGTFTSAVLSANITGLPAPVIVVGASIGISTNTLLYTQFGNLCMIQPTMQYTVTMTSFGTVTPGTTGYNLLLSTACPQPTSVQVVDPQAVGINPATSPQTYLSGTWGMGTGGLGLTISWTIGDAGAPVAGSVYNGIVPPISYATA